MHTTSKNNTPTHMYTFKLDVACKRISVLSLMKVQHNKVRLHLALTSDDLKTTYITTYDVLCPIWLSTPVPR